ncbi:MAG: response regulator transcription factor [Acidobacteriia bacterium]|nr:response regulator transcription factor [Terriglobia bacterium]
MNKPKVLIVEDEPNMVMGLTDNFEIEGYEVVSAPDGETGLAKALSEKPSLILLDIMMPKKSGLDVCRELRAKGFAAPIIMLTARGQEVDKVVGLEVGADDYVTKPFSIRELLARVKAVLRRVEGRGRGIQQYSFGGIDLDFEKHRATRNRRPMDLSTKEFELLKYFVQHRGETVTRDRLLDEVWGYDQFPNTRTVDNHVAKVRQKIEEVPSDPKYIITIHGVGYKFLG